MQALHFMVLAQVTLETWAASPDGVGFRHEMSGGILRNLCLQKQSNNNETGLSENSVPLNPMVNDHYPYQMAIIGIPYFQTNPNKGNPK